MNYEIAMSDEELMRELQGLMDYWPMTVEELPVGEAYPRIAALSKRCTVIVGESVSKRVH